METNHSESNPVFTDERHRAYLRLVARSLTLPRLQSKLDASDLIQETLLRAHVAWPRVHCSNEAELLQWLRSILFNVFRDTVRRFHADARDARIETYLDQALQDSTRRVEHWLADQSDSPGTAAVQLENLLRLAESLARLPDDQRAAVELKYLQGCSLGEIAAYLERTRASVAGLLRRGTETIRELMRDFDGGN